MSVGQGMESGTPTISVVIPTYNGTVFLAEAIRSALAQTHAPLEIIVVDDGSPADIERLVAPFLPRVRYVRQENAGPAAARNYGVSLAQGDLIAFLDDDDLWHPRKLEEQVRMITEHPQCAMVYSCPVWIDEQGRDLRYRGPDNFPSGFIYPDLVARNCIATPSVTLIRRSVFDSCGHFDENREYFCGEDYDLWLRISARHEVRFCPGRLVSYRVRSAGISRNPDNALKGDLYVIDKLLARHRQEPLIADADFYAALDDNLYHTLRRFAYRYYDYDDRDTAKLLLMRAFKRPSYYASIEHGPPRPALLIRFNRACPYYVKDMVYLMLFCLPDKPFHLLRNVKRSLSAFLSVLAGKRTA